MKVNQFNMLLIIVFLGTFSSFAQQAKPSPKPKITNKTTQKVPNVKAATKTDGNQAKAQEYFNQGKQFWKELEISKTIEAYTKALELYPDFLEALSERGIVYFLIRQPRAALTDFDKVLKSDPNSVRILHYRGLALTEIAVITKDDENDRKTANSFAQRALSDFNRVIELDPNDYSYYNARGKLFLEFDFYKEAIADYQKSNSIKPNAQAYAYLGLAKFYAGEGRGLEEVDKALGLEYGYAEAFYIRGTINRTAKRYEEAIVDFEYAIRFNKNSAKYYNSRGMVYFIKQDGYAAVADFTSAINEDREFAMAYYNRGLTYKKYPYSVSKDDNAVAKIRLQRDKMLEDFSSAIKYKPNFAEAYIERGLINSTDMRNKSTPDAETINRLNLALSDFEQAIKLDPKSAEAFNGRASCRDNLGKKDLALADYSKAIELDPDLATAYMGRMAIYCEMGKKELSIVDEKKIKELGFAALNVCNLGGK